MVNDDRPPSRGQRRRLWRAASAPLLFLGSVVTLAVASGAPASAATPTAVAVAGVNAFGIGASQTAQDLNGVSPEGVALNSSGDLFEVNFANGQVLEYTPSSTSPSLYSQTGIVVAGGGGQGSGLNQLSYPSGVALDAKGDLFVSDSDNDRIVEYPYNSSTGTFAASGVVVAGTGKSGSGSTQLYDPQGIALDAKGDLLVADLVNDRVQEFPYNASTGTFASTATTVAGTGTSGSGNNQLDGPTSIALQPSGNLFISDTYNFRIMEYAFNASTGTYNSSGTIVVSGLPALSGWLAFDPSGNLYLSYQYLGYGNVLEFAYSASTGTFAGTGVAIGADAGNGDMVGPEGLAFDAKGDLFVSETQETSDPSNTVWGFVLELTDVAGTYTPIGTIMSQTGRVNNGVSSVVVDSHKNLFVADNDVYEFPFNPSTGTYGVVGKVIATTAGALALDSSNDLFVATGTAVQEYAWNASTASYPAAGSNVPGATQLDSIDVTSLAFDAQDDLFAATGNEVLKFPYNASTGTYASSGTVVATITSGPAGSEMVSGVTGIALDGSDDLFVSNGSENIVEEFLYQASTGTYATTGITVAGVGGMGYGTNQLYEPMQLAVDHAGDLYVYDGGNGRLIEFTGNSATGAYAANGTVIYPGFQDNWPEEGGITLDSTGDLFFGFNFSDATVYEMASIASPPPPPAAPVVTGISPSSGSTAGGTVVTVSGSNLSGGSVSFGSTAATAVSCSASSCSATSPAGTGTVNVTVTTTGGTSATSSADQFTYVAAPTITSISPTSGTTAGGTSVTITGTNLASTSAVDFGSSAATVTTDTATSIVATTPAGSAGAVNVSVTTAGGRVSETSAYTYVAPSSSTNLIPDPGFQTSVVPADYWGSTLARSQAQVYGSTWSLAQTTTSSSGGWDLDSNLSWCVPISSTKTYTASIWVRSSAAVTVDLNLDLLTASGSYVNSAGGPNVVLVANTWTELSITGIKVTSSEALAGMEPNFSKATKGSLIYWDDMSLTSP